MTASVLMVIVVVIPASAASLAVLGLDVRSSRRRPPARRVPAPSRITAVAGAALGVAGFCLASLAGVTGHGLSARASGLSSDESMWVVTAGADPGTGTLGTVLSGSTASPVTLPFAPFTLWGTGVDQGGSYTLVAEVPGVGSVPLLPGTWPNGGRETRPLALFDPAAIVAAARANGVLPEQGAYTLELVTEDPAVRLQLVLPAQAAPAPVPAVPPPGPVTVTLPSQLVPLPVTGAVAAAQRPAAGATSAAGATGARVGVPATGGGASVIAGLALLLAGGGSAIVSLRLRRGAAA